MEENTAIEEWEREAVKVYNHAVNAYNQENAVAMRRAVNNLQQINLILKQCAIEIHPRVTFLSDIPFLDGKCCELEGNLQRAKVCYSTGALLKNERCIAALAVLKKI
jgi:hypothetical protein